MIVDHLVDGTVKSQDRNRRSDVMLADTITCRTTLAAFD